MHIMIAVILIVVGICGLWQAPLRISQVSVYGGYESVKPVVMTAIQGSYFGIIPKDSILFFPDDRVRSDIMATYSDIAAVSIFRNGLNSITIKINDRIPVARWCGAAPDLTASSSPQSCYFFDPNGVLFTTADKMMPINASFVYEDLGDELSTTSPVGLVLPNANKFPTMFDFARKLSTLGSSTVSIVIQEDEVHMNQKSGTRITYVLGKEQEAYTALLSANKGLNFADGSISYVDLRFPDKVYIKKK